MTTEIPIDPISTMTQTRDEMIAELRESPAFQRFLDLAQHGQYRVSDPIEKHAARLAEAVVEHAQFLESQLREGLVEFMEFAARYPATAKKLLEDGLAF
ncbi:MAG: hypothetical protein FWD61_11590 [Phycisphaerales bacterium]|nr:hypothetical protein [Phycisphaerales bacterium]